MKIVLTNANGNTMCGTDGCFTTHGNVSLHETVRKEAREYRKRFKKNFPHKYESWTHFGIVSSFREDPKAVYPIEV